MPRWCSGGCFSLPCTQEDDEWGEVYKDPLALNLDDDDFDDFSVKNDFLDLTKEDLSQFTDQFSLDNLVGVSQFGKLYRGKMITPICLNKEDDDNGTTKDVAVKILIDTRYFRDYKDLLRLEDELKFVQDPSIMGNVNLVKVIGCCREDKFMGVVYDLNPRDTLHNLIIRDDFNWLQRVKTALALARLLNILHDRKSPYVLRNINPAHIVVDQDFNPFLFDFGMVVAKVLGKRINEHEAGTFGYIDPAVALAGWWSIKADVYAFGVLLLNLMSKRLTDPKNIGETNVGWWALKEYKPGCSLVHPSLEDDPCYDSLDGPIMTDLARQCIDEERMNRPLMNEVVNRLEALHVVQCYVDKK